MSSPHQNDVRQTEVKKYNHLSRYWPENMTWLRKGTYLIRNKHEHVTRPNAQYKAPVGLYQKEKQLEV